MAFIIDFSAHDAWLRCPAYWYELYVNKRRKRWPTALRDDALCLGSLVHAGMEIWQRHHKIEIPAEVINENTPDQATLALAMELIYGYTRAYPEDPWPLIVCEEPLQFDLGEYCGVCLNPNTYPDDERQCSNCQAVWDPILIGGLAKLDEYFFVPEYTEIATGVGDLKLPMTRGWWINEYKTRSSYIPMHLWMQDWEMKLQASYQLLALREHLKDQPEPIGGLLVNVMEKPRKYVPKRKCKKCDESYEFAMWIPTLEAYRCPVCNTEQKLQPLRETTRNEQPVYYRIPVIRTPQELEFDQQQMIQVAERMIEMEQGGLHSEVWNKSQCVSFQYKRACDYFAAHKGGGSTMQDELNYFTPERDYRGLIQLGD